MYLYLKKISIKQLIAVPIFFFMLLANNAMADEDVAAACIELLQACSESASIAAEKAAECKELGSCKKDCGIGKGSCKVDAKVAKTACLAKCTRPDKKSCKQNCRRVFRNTKASCRNVKSECVQDCKKEFLTPECEAVRASRLDRFLGSLPECSKYEECVNRDKPPSN